MLALSLELQREGHHILLVGPPEKPQWVEEYGCPFYPFGNNLAAFIDSMTLTRVFNNKRKILGLKPFPDYWLHVLGEDVIVASDKELVGLPMDLGIKSVQTGYSHLHQKKSTTQH